MDVFWFCEILPPTIGFHGISRIYRFIGIISGYPTVKQNQHKIMPSLDLFHLIVAPTLPPFLSPSGAQPHQPHVRTETHLPTKEDTATPSSAASAGSRATSLASFVASEFAERQDATSGRFFVRQCRWQGLVQLTKMVRYPARYPIDIPS